MSEDTENAIRNPYDYSSDPDGLTAKDIRTHDIYLDALLEMVLGPSQNRGNTESSLSLTVTAGGLTVSGSAISAQAWAEGMGPTVAKVHPVLSEGFTSFHDDIMEMLDERRERREREDRPQPARRFLHLKDVIIFTNGAKPLELPLWRAPLSAVTGWTLGRLSFDEDLPTN